MDGLDLDQQFGPDRFYRCSRSADHMMSPLEKRIKDLQREVLTTLNHTATQARWYDHDEVVRAFKTIRAHTKRVMASSTRYLHEE